MSESRPRRTLIAGIGPFGRSVLGDLRDELTPLPPEERDAIALVPIAILDEFGEEERVGLRTRFTSEAERLLRVGVERTVQLDLAIVADVAEVGSDYLVAVAEAFSEMLASSFGVMFPPELSPHERAVTLNIFLGSPALTRSEEGQGALRTCAALERWHAANPPSPCLARIWLAPRQTTGGILSEEDLQRSVHLFLLALYISGLRDSEAVRSRLAPPRDPRRILATFSIAAAAVPVNRVLEYCSWRTALAGLENLAAQIDRPEPTPQELEEATEVLHARDWLAQFDPEREGQIATRLRQAERNTKPCSLVTPPEAPPRFLESGTAVLRRNDGLLQEQTPEEVASTVPENAPLLRQTDRAERDLLMDVRQTLRAWITERLTPANGLRDILLIQRGLDHLASWFERQATQTPVEWSAPENNPSMPPDRSALRNLIAAAQAKPSLGSSLLTAIPLAGALSVAATVLCAAFGSPIVGDPLLKVLGPGLALGLIGGIAWFTGTHAMARAGLQRALESRRVEIETSGPSGRASASASRRIQVALAARRRRTCLEISRTLREQAVRVGAIRTALHEAIQRARGELGTLRVKPGTTTREDDTSGLLPKPGPLQWPLISSSALPLLCLKTRQVQDEAVWASRLLESAWPSGGIEPDLPFADEKAWLGAASAQHEALKTASPFEWPDTDLDLRGRVATFLPVAIGALAFGVRPVQEDGTPQPLADSSDLLAVAPPAGTEALARVRTGYQGRSLTVLAATARSPRIIVLVTGAEFDAAAAWRGL